MKLPTYERQNKWIQDYIVPLCELNFAKIARNYRMNRGGPFTDERMAQIREDVLAGMRESLESNSRADPLRNYSYDNTYSKDGEKTRVVHKDSYGGGLRLAPLEMRFITKDTPAPLSDSDKFLADLLRFSDDDNRVIMAELRKSGSLKPFNYLAQGKS